MNEITKIKVDGEPESSYQLYPRNEEFAKRAGGNGGSQSVVQPDWNQNDETQPDYVKNRPFYTGGPVETVLVEENTATFRNGEAELAMTFVATVGETYKVYWDGAAYECICVDFNGDLVIGNLSIPGAGSDTGEPFLMIVVNGRAITIYTLDTSASHTFSISAFVPEVVKIATKYLPFDITQYKAPIVVEKDPRALSDEEKEHINDTFKSGGIVVLTNSDVVSNNAILTYFNFDKTSSHMQFTCFGGSYMYYYDSDVNSSIFEVNLSNDGIKSIADFQTKYILRDDPLSYFVLLSSTTDSTKKFKITVDDSGALTATEVT